MDNEQTLAMLWGYVKVVQRSMYTLIFCCTVQNMKGSEKGNAVLLHVLTKHSYSIFMLCIPLRC
jgi:hypothetical protein